MEDFLLNQNLVWRTVLITAWTLCPLNKRSTGMESSSLGENWQFSLTENSCDGDSRFRYSRKVDVSKQTIKLSNQVPNNTRQSQLLCKPILTFKRRRKYLVNYLRFLSLTRFFDIAKCTWSAGQIWAFKSVHSSWIKLGTVVPISTHKFYHPVSA